jgi:formimidoylglutamate deiminase
MAHYYHLDSVLLPQGWTRDALVTVAENGLITAIDTGGDVAPGSARRELSSHSHPPEAERVPGFVVPGMPNAHSHAFQRGMTGNTEYRRSARDSFWTWRQAMYGLANRIEPADLQVLATQLFIEMLKAGYTSVAEFHYLHRRPAGGHYPAGGGLWDAITAAAAVSGIGLTLLPTLYQTSDFGSAPLKPEQARFASDTDWFLRAVEERIAAERMTGAAALRTGAAFHSLRAVPLETLREAALALRRIDPALPLHIHVAEQVQEVESCKTHTGRRPVELLLETGLLDQHWCLVHATHATVAELRGVAATKATVCLSVTTEANLGDGFFEAARFLKMGGRLCVGSDSQATVCPAEELRWLEYQQRLRKRRRAVLADKRDSHVGTRLWREAAQHGAQAIGQPAGTIEVGRRADWLVLDSSHPSMSGSIPDNALDHLIFAGASAAVRDVMVAGRWVVQNYRHAAEPALQAPFADLMKRLAPSEN